MADVRKKAEALIGAFDKHYELGGWEPEFEDAYNNLKAALRPSREEIADYLKDIEHNKIILDSVSFGQLVCGKEGLSLHSCNESRKWIKYAIEELRSKEEMTALRPSREEIADCLEKHNKWRRGGNDAMQAPKELGNYIDYAIEELRK